MYCVCVYVLLFERLTTEKEHLVWLYHLVSPVARKLTNRLCLFFFSSSLNILTNSALGSTKTSSNNILHPSRTLITLSLFPSLPSSLFRSSSTPLSLSMQTGPLSPCLSLSQRMPMQHSFSFS